MASQKEIDSYYRDQSIQVTDMGTKMLTAAYTWYGLKRMDSMYCNKILNMPNKKYADKLRKEIQENPHLHEKIKENLLYNLKNMRKELNAASQRRWEALEAKKPYRGRRVIVHSGLNQGIVGTVRWFDEGHIGMGRVGVDSDNRYWMGYVYDTNNTQYYDREQVQVISEEQYQEELVLEQLVVDLLEEQRKEEKQAEWEKENPQLEFDFK